MYNPESIKKCVLFQGLSTSEYDVLANVTIVREYAKGEIIFLDGDEATGFFALLSGKVRVFKSNPDGKEVTIHIINPGQIFAEVAIFEGRKFPASSITLEKSEIAFFPKGRFLELIKRHPTISLKIIASLSGFLREYNQMVDYLALKEVPSRIAQYLLDQSERQESVQIKLSISKTEMAKRLGTISETLSRGLKKLSDNGIIQVDKNHIIIQDKSKLISIAEGEKI